MPETTLVFRTHLWDDSVDFCARQLRRATSARIVVSADETHGPVDVPAGFEKIAHSLDAFAAMGLPILPSPEKAMWHCGDYPLYQIAAQIPASHYLMIEGDVAMTGPVDTLLDRLEAEGLDYATSDFRKMARRNPHLRGNVDLFYPPGTEGPTELYTGAFPTVFASAALIGRMQQERLRMARISDSPDNWIYCEDFAPIVARRFGFRTAALMHYADTTQQHWLQPILPEEVAMQAGTDTVRVFHPVFHPPKWERKMIQYQKWQIRSLRKTVKTLKDELAAERARDRP